MQSELRQSGFDYSAVPVESRESVEAATGRLHSLERRTSEAIIEIGKELIQVKKDIGHGNFLPWLESEFGWSERNARRFMEVADVFKSAKLADLNGFQPSALYALASPSTPDDIRAEFTELAELGNRVTHKDVQERIQESRRAEPIPVSDWEREPIDVDEDTGEIYSPTPTPAPSHPLPPIQKQPPKGQPDTLEFMDYGADDPDLTYKSIAYALIHDYGRNAAMRIAAHIQKETVA